MGAINAAGTNVSVYEPYPHKMTDYYTNERILTELPVSPLQHARHFSLVLMAAHVTLLGLTCKHFRSGLTIVGPSLEHSPTPQESAL